MLDSIRFVRGSVDKKSLHPSFTFFHITGGMIYGGNGIVSAGCPIATNIEASPKAEEFFRIIEKSRGTISLSITPAARLRVQADGLRAFIPCLPAPDVPPPLAGACHAPKGALLPALKALEPFISEDASRPWSRGILIRNGIAYATNNVVLAKFPCDCLPEGVEVNLPSRTIDELLRIGEEPKTFVVEKTTLGFLYENGAWIRSSLLSCTWPASCETLLETVFDYTPVTASFREAVEGMKNFLAPDRGIYLNGNTVSTTTAEEDGVTLSFEEDVGSNKIGYTYLLQIAQYAKEVQFVTGGKVSGFRAGELIGVVAGMR